MNKLIMALCLALCLAGLGLGSRALAAPSDDEKLLVVVEESPGTDVGAAEVRRAISAELGTPVLAPADDDAGESVKVLVVALERGRVRMAMHASAAGISSRTIPAPDDRQAKLRAIGWLAGNLARDQVSRIVAMPSEPEGKPTVEQSPVVEAAVEARSATEPPPQPAPAAVASVAPPAAVLQEQASAVATGEGSRWSVTIAGGAAAMWVGSGSFGRIPSTLGFMYSPSYQLEVARAPARGHIFGAALDVGSSGGGGSFLYRQTGAAGFFGSSWRRGRFVLEATAGLGLEAISQPTISDTFTQSSSGTVSSSSITQGMVLLLYARGVGTVVLPIGDSFDLVARLGVYLQSSGLDNTYASATVGARLRLP